MRLVDADELIERAYRLRLDSREQIAQMIESSPTVEIVLDFTSDPPKRGHWIWSETACEGNPYGRYVCSHCAMNHQPHKTKYCSYCGALMDEGEVKDFD